jgi:hypothetical protein
MRTFIRLFISFLLLTATVSALGYFFWYKPKFDHGMNHDSSITNDDVNTTALLRLKQKATQLASYGQAEDYNSQHCFFIDMRIASGKKRFFVYNLKKDSVEAAGLVTHGSGSDKGNNDLYFSNVSNSNCTSLGKYKIGNSYNGKFGLAFKLHGLDRTNSKAFERFVVLHAHSCVPDDEVSPLPICESWGCPTVSPTFLTAIKKYIDHADKPIVLWIYY